MFNITRSPQNPFISPDKTRPWEAGGTFNWSPVKTKEKLFVAYRALSDLQLLGEQKGYVSVVARAESTDGIAFIEKKPFITPKEDFEKYGCEDPRVTKIDDTYYIFYTALSTYPFNADGIKVAVALSKDMETVYERHLVTPFNAKAMALFPEKINGKYTAILSVDTDKETAKICIAEFESLEQMWDESYWHEWYKNISTHEVLLRRDGNEQVEVGAVPLKTKHGWLLIYSHIANYRSSEPIFGIEAALLDIKNPRAIIGRTNFPFLVPETYYEKTGMVQNIVFPSGALIDGDTLEIYYGGADTHCARATTSLSALLCSLIPEKKNAFVKRFAKNPILTPRKGKAWEAGGVFNPGVIDIQGTAHILYRAVTTENYSVLGYASSLDGLSIKTRDADPVYLPRAPFEGLGMDKNAGCEDPRLIELEKTIYMTYTAYDGHTPRIAITSIPKKDFVKKNWNAWTYPELISEPNVPNKDAFLLPEKVNDMYYMFHRVQPSICADIFPTLDFKNRKIVKCIEVAEPRRGMWDSKKIGMAGPAIKTKKGWLAFYHGIGEDHVYRVGALLLDLKNPVVVLARSALPIFEPVTDYELRGVVHNVVFPCGQIVRGGTVYLYYGAADFTTAVATVKLSDVLKTLIHE